MAIFGRFWAKNPKFQVRCGGLRWSPKLKILFSLVLYIGIAIETTWTFENHDLVPPLLKPRCFQEATVFVWNCKLTESCNMLSPVWHFDTYIIDILWHYKALHVVTFAIFCGGTMLSSNIKHKWYPPSPLRKNDLSLLSLVFSIEQNTIKSNYTYTINLDVCGLSENSELCQRKALL